MVVVVVVVVVAVEGPAWCEVSVLGVLCLSAKSLSWNHERGRMEDKTLCVSQLSHKTERDKGETRMSTTASHGPNGLAE